MGKMLDPREMTIATVAIREELLESIDKALDLRQMGVASRYYQTLVGLDRLAEELGILDDRSDERAELSGRIIAKLSMPWEEARVHAE